MTKTIALNSLTLAIFTMAISPSTVMATNSSFIEPPMVSIPAGSFYMGSDRGQENERPVRKVSVPAFQMGKYEVTVAEFKKFIADTGYEMPNNCYQYVLGGPNQELASWNDTIYNFSDNHPVVCLPQKAAADYAKWLSKKTGNDYRLPTEAQWEYTLRAGTATRHFYGEERDSGKSCQYANISDWYAADMSAKIFTGASVRDIESCSDNEATLATVGLYQANPFGVHDMIGNVMEYLADCYVDNYNDAPTDGSAVTTTDCNTHVVRGGSWHWYPWHSSERSSIGSDFLGALEGFRLVLDTGGKVLPSQTGSKKFVKQLRIAQNKIKAQHKQNAAYPNKPSGLKVISANKNQVTLSWNNSNEKILSGYKVYRQDPITNEKVTLANNIDKASFVDNSPLTHNARYSVVALNGKTESQSSDIIDSAFTTLHNLPVKIQGEAFIYANNAQVRDSVQEPKHDKVFASLGESEAAYQIQVANSGTFTIDARVYHAGDEQEFELWLGDQKVATPSVSGDSGWKTVTNITIQLPQGNHTLIVKGKKPMFAVNWLDVKAI
ncbi:SUMF1/EgtB/PvdO family nonheme iron enzyme [Colwellia piezophila]|uniref:SUMF1/EgtB/PvdO family nonheme iron enzyme n=1 Tax=Colwellia piezophila TaxID=211668 RepID=UPI00037D0317|nr:SUMF1/EgtB/PvdO family nonheme iron enzyme [Colwellia piezophila]